MVVFKRFFLISLVFPMALIAAENPAEQAPSNAAGAPVAAGENDKPKDDPNEMICRREQVTGSNFRRRVCMTRAERQARRADSQEEMLERRSAIRDQ